MPPPEPKSERSTRLILICIARIVMFLCFCGRASSVEDVKSFIGKSHFKHSRKKRIDPKTLSHKSFCSELIVAAFNADNIELALDIRDDHYFRQAPDKVSVDCAIEACIEWLVKRAHLFTKAKRLFVWELTSLEPYSSRYGAIYYALSRGHPRMMKAILASMPDTCNFDVPIRSNENLEEMLCIALWEVRNRIHDENKVEFAWRVIRCIKIMIEFGLYVRMDKNNSRTILNEILSSVNLASKFDYNSYLDGRFEGIRDFMFNYLLLIPAIVAADFICGPCVEVV